MPCLYAADKRYARTGASSELIMLTFNPEKIRNDFPILTYSDSPLVYLDSAASAQKPCVVIDRLDTLYRREYSSVHRGVHRLSEHATAQFEASRVSIQKFLNAQYAHEIIFVRGTTEAINLVASSYGRTQCRAGDELIISAMEHHSNIVPWQILCQQTGALLKIIPVDTQGQLQIDVYKNLLSPRTKLVALTHVSNVLGTINPIKQIIALAHQNNTPVLIDGAQGIVHTQVDVQDLDCDFYAFSGHKLFGPSGIGVLYGKQNLLEAMPPYQTGGGMITTVNLEQSQYRELPYRFEAGTPSIAGAIGLATAIDYLNQIDRAAAHCHEQMLLHMLTDNLLNIPKLHLIGTAEKKASILSFVLDDVHAHDIGTILAASDIAVRVGHHCCMPLMQQFHVPATVRASLAFYNNQQDIEALITALHTVRTIFK